MPDHKSAIKRMGQNEVRRVRNQHNKTLMKTSHKKVLVAVEAGNKEEGEKALKDAIKTISKACSKGVIHKNNKARKISKLTRKVNAIAAASNA